MAERRHTRRANGEGAIWQEGKYHVGRLTIDGKRHKVRAKTREGVAGKIFTLKQQAAAGTLVDTSRKWKVGEWLEEWLSGVFVEPQTFDGYRRHVRTYLTPAFGHLPLGSLGTQQIRAFCQQKMTPRDQGGAGLHQTTVSNIGRTLRIALGAAVDLNLIAKNPAAVRRTIPTPASREMQTWNRDECQRFLAAAKGTAYEALFNFALATGARQGEMRALRWSAVDLRAGTVAIKASISAGRGRKSTKSDSGVRLLHLPPYLVQLLTERKAARDGAQLDQDDLVFPNESGNPFDVSNVRLRHQLPLMKQARVRIIRFHDLRHTFATLMLQAGVPIKDVSYMLGHADAAITIRVYAHAIPATHGSHAALMGEILTGSDEPLRRRPTVVRPRVGARRTPSPAAIVARDLVAAG